MCVCGYISCAHAHPPSTTPTYSLTHTHLFRQLSVSSFFLPVFSNLLSFSSLFRLLSFAVGLFLLSFCHIIFFATLFQFFSRSLTYLPFLCLSRSFTVCSSLSLYSLLLSLCICCFYLAEFTVSLSLSLLLTLSYSLSLCLTLAHSHSLTLPHSNSLSLHCVSESVIRICNSRQLLSLSLSLSFSLFLQSPLSVDNI